MEMDRNRWSARLSRSALRIESSNARQLRRVGARRRLDDAFGADLDKDGLRAKRPVQECSVLHNAQYDT